jgi:flagellar hook assembly protein FlgD
VSLAVYDITGKLIKTLVLGSEPAGYKTIRWDGNDNFGKSVPNGLYFIRLETPKFSATDKLVLTR